MTQIKKKKEAKAILTTDEPRLTDKEKLFSLLHVVRQMTHFNLLAEHKSSSVPIIT